MERAGKAVLIALIVTLLDQVTKFLAKSLSGEIKLLPGVLQLKLITNTGGAFGILPGTNTILLWVGVIAIGAILLFHEGLLSEKGWWCYALITGGILGNLIDRIFLGHVIDFIAPSFWPAFNIADSALTIGVLGLLLYSMKKSP